MTTIGWILGDCLGLIIVSQNRKSAMSTVILDNLGGTRDTSESDLRERMNELNCVYRVTEAISVCEFSIPALLETVVRHIPPAFRYPEHCGARLTVHEVVRQTEGYVDSTYKLAQNIVADGEIVGSVEVSYVEDSIQNRNVLFPPEEHRLILALSQRLGKAVEHIHVHEALLAERAALAAKNTALREVLALARKDREDLTAQITANVNSILMPTIQSLEGALPGTLRSYASLLRESLRDIASPLMRQISLEHEELTLVEIQICQLIRQGLTAKEIARIRSISPITVFRHRQSIRRKLGVTNKNVNLANYLGRFTRRASAIPDEVG